MNVLFASLALAATTTLVPLNDLGSQPYLYGYYGGLWDVVLGEYSIPADHAAAGLQQAALIQPRDADGNPDPNGKVVFLSAGYRNTARTFEQFQAMAAADPSVNHDSLVMLNAAGDHLDVMKWEQPWQPVYNQVINDVLAPAGVSAAQVQAVWIQQINEHPDTPLPVQYGDAYLVKASLANMLRAMKTTFPNLQIAYLSSPEYAGYDSTRFLGEPFAYEDGLAVRFVLNGQIEGIRKGEQWDPRIANLSYAQGVAPWATWGPYLWANGTTPRSDGLTWQRSDFEDDGVTLSAMGARKSASMLLRFMTTEPTAVPWFVPAVRRTPVKQRAVRP